MPRPTPDHSYKDSHTYIPAAAQQAMSRQLQQGAPAHLKQYLGNDHKGYVPPRIQQELASYVQRSVSPHLQGYAGAFVQQNVVDKSLRTPLATHSGSTPPPPRPSRLNQSHSGDIPAAQQGAQFYNLFQPDAAAQPMMAAPGEAYGNAAANPANAQPGAAASSTQPAPSAPQAPDSPYEFIMNPPKTPKGPNLLTSGSPVKRALIFGGGLVVLIMLVTVVASLLKGGQNTAPLLAVAQEQTELARVASEGVSSSNDAATKAFASAVQLSAVSATHQLTAYMTDNHDKLNVKLLGLKYDASADTRLKNALSDNTYDSTLVNILETDLTSYSQALRTAYQANPGPRGRQMLNSQYSDAQLLILQGQQAQTNLAAAD